MTRTTILCPNFEDHTHQPQGYIEWHAWAETMSKTHKQRRCNGCGLYEIWEPKREPAPFSVRAILESNHDRA